MRHIGDSGGRHGFLRVAACIALGAGACGDEGTGGDATVAVAEVALEVEVEVEVAEAETAVTGPTVQVGAAVGTVKPLLGENGGPMPASTHLTAEFTAAYQEIGVRAVRTHDILLYWAGESGPGALDMWTMFPDRLRDPSLEANYDFALADTYFASIVDGGFVPFFRIGDSASMAHPPLPGEQAHWAQAAVEVMRHYTEAKWGGFTADIPEVEIWNEPDSTNFWSRTRDEFLSLYVQTAKALRTAFPALRIGGPGFTRGALKSTASGTWLPAFLDRVKADGAPLDFLSFHVYTNDPAEPAAMAVALRELLDGQGFVATDIYITEWNTQVNVAQDPDAARELRSGARGAAVLTATWIALQDSPVGALYHYRGSGLNPTAADEYGLYLGTGGAKRPAYAFKAWSALAATTARLATAVAGDDALRALAGRDAAGATVILVANTAATASSWTPTDADGKPLAGAWQVSTLSDAAVTPSAAPATFPVAIPAYGVQVLSAGP